MAQSSRFLSVFCTNISGDTLRKNVKRHVHGTGYAVFVSDWSQWPRSAEKAA